MSLHLIAISLSRTSGVCLLYPSPRLTSWCGSQTSASVLFFSSSRVRFARFHVASMPNPSSSDMIARNLISHKITTLGGYSQSTLTTSRFVRLLLLCVTMGVWPLLATLTSILLQTRIGDPIPSWPGWATVHNHFYDIPALSYQSLTEGDVRNYVRGVWYGIITASLVSCIFIGTEDVRDDLSRFWRFLIHKVPSVHQWKLVLPFRSSHEGSTSNHGLHRFVLVTLVPGVSDKKTQLAMSASPGEPIGIAA